MKPFNSFNMQKIFKRGFKLLKDKRYIVQTQRARNLELENKAITENLPWRTVVSW